MLEQQHTPAPWHLYQGKGSLAVYVNSDVTERAIAEFPYDDGETLANARLIAAAPELLGALEEVLNQLATNYAQAVSVGHRWPNERVNMTSAAQLLASRAIAKARGEV